MYSFDLNKIFHSKTSHQYATVFSGLFNISGMNNQTVHSNNINYIANDKASFANDKQKLLNDLNTVLSDVIPTT